MLARLQRWISGMESSRSDRKESSVKRRKHYVRTVECNYLSLALSTGTTRSLPRVRFGNGHHEQRLESRRRLRHTELHHSRVDDVFDSGNGHGRFGEVRRENHLARVGRRRREHNQLLLRRKRGVERKHLHGRGRERGREARTRSEAAISACPAEAAPVTRSPPVP